jgi:hypothetical protein
MLEELIDRLEARRRVDADPEQGWCRHEYGARLFGIEPTYDTLAALLRAAATWSARRFFPAPPLGRVSLPRGAPRQSEPASVGGQH